jgi:hypothetical protein
VYGRDLPWAKHDYVCEIPGEGETVLPFETSLTRTGYSIPRFSDECDALRKLATTVDCLRLTQSIDFAGDGPKPGAAALVLHQNQSVPLSESTQRERQSAPLPVHECLCDPPVIGRQDQLLKP